MFSDFRPSRSARAARLLLPIVAGSVLLSTLPVGRAQEPEIKEAASKIAEKLTKEKRNRILVADFYGPERQVVTELGRDLADELSIDLARTNPDFVVLPRSTMEVHFLKHTANSLPGPYNGSEYNTNLALDNLQEHAAALDLAFFAQADTVVVGRLSRRSSRLRLDLHVYVTGNPFTSGRKELPVSDVGQLWTHELRTNFAIKNEHQNKMDNVLRQLPKDTFGLSAGLGEKEEKLLNAECMACGEVPLDTGVILYLVLRVGSDGGVTVESITSQPPIANGKPRAGTSSGQVSGEVADTIRTEVSKWHFKPFSADAGQVLYVRRLLVIDGVRHTIDLLPFALST